MKMRTLAALTAMALATTLAACGQSSQQLADKAKEAAAKAVDATKDAAKASMEAAKDATKDAADKASAAARAPPTLPRCNEGRRRCDKDAPSPRPTRRRTPQARLSTRARKLPTRLLPPQGRQRRSEGSAKK
jgi:hypothetical protein